MFGKLKVQLRNKSVRHPVKNGLNTHTYTHIGHHTDVSNTHTRQYTDVSNIHTGHYTDITVTHTEDNTLMSGTHTGQHTAISNTKDNTPLSVTQRITHCCQ